MVGGTSHMESFDPKPELNKYADKTFAETPYKGVLDSPHLKKNLRELIAGLHTVHPKIYPMQVGFRKRGESGIAVSDWWPHLGDCIDDIAVVRSMWTTDNNHGAQLQFHTGRHVLEGTFPTIGSWVHYGLGSLNDDLPQFVVLGTPIADCCGGRGGHGAHYLGPDHDGVELAVDPKNPLPFAAPGPDVYHEEQQGEFELLGRLNALSAVAYPDDPALRARIKSYELAFRMQAAVPDVLRFSAEGPATQALYGLDQAETKTFGEQCLAARRLVERGTRFVQIFHGSNGGAGAWDAHGNLKAGHTALCKQVDRPIAGLLEGPEAARPARRDAGRLGDRVRPDARGAGGQRPRPPPLRLLGLDGRRRDQGGRSPTGRPTSWASTRSRTATTSPTSTPRSCTSSGWTRAGWRSPARSGWRSTTASRSTRSSRRKSPGRNPAIPLPSTGCVVMTALDLGRWIRLGRRNRWSCDTTGRSPVRRIRVEREERCDGDG